MGAVNTEAIKAKQKVERVLGYLNYKVSVLKKIGMTQLPAEVNKLIEEVDEGVKEVSESIRELNYSIENDLATRYKETVENMSDTITTLLNLEDKESK